jgi:hypothetical protein
MVIIIVTSSQNEWLDMEMIDLEWSKSVTGGVTEEKKCDEVTK